MKYEEALDAKKYKKVLVEQEYKGCKMDFDPDSSPSAIEYYKIIYKDSDWKILREFDFEKLEKSNGKRFTRLLVCLSSKSDYRNDDNFGPKFKLGGDVDFNFNEDKVSKLCKFLSEKNKNKLYECSKMHHTLLNMSLIASTGGLNILKNGLYINNGSIACGGSQLDRQDTFISILNEYFQSAPASKKRHFLFEKSSPANKESLENYLSKFSDIYEYCETIHFIKDRKIVDELIGNGKKEISSEEDVVRYMELAHKYWLEKEKNVSVLLEK